MNFFNFTTCYTHYPLKCSCVFVYNSKQSLYEKFRLYSGVNSNHVFLLSSICREIMNISFAGCGFRGVYHIGVIACLQRHGKGFMKNILGYGGASAGSLVAALLATSTPLEHGLKFTTELAIKVRRYFLGALNPSFDLMHHLDEGLRAFLPEDAHERANGKLYVSVSRFPKGDNSIVSQFDSREDLIQVTYCICNWT